MGRAKLNMELISKEKSRNVTFRKRKVGLMKKIYELTTLCDVKACMIIYGPTQEKGSFGPDIWPENVEEIQRMIDIYKAKSKDSRNKSYGLSDFFHDRKKKVEDELAKLRKKNVEGRYPTWVDFLNGFTDVQLREFAANLRVKLEDLRSRVNYLKKSKEVLDANWIDFGRMNPFQNQSFYNPGMIQRGNVEFEAINQQAISSIKPTQYCPNFDHSLVLQNSRMMPMLNDNDHYVQFGGASTSGNISFNHQGFYESTATDPMICYSPTSLAQYYTPPVAPTPYMMSGVLPAQIPAEMPPLPQLPGFSKEICGGFCALSGQRAPGQYM